MTKKAYRILNKPYIPKEVSEMKGPILLHISDTTEEAYKYIIKVVEEISPQYIVHTGDIVDNIKLESNYNYLEGHRRALKNFIEAIEKYPAKFYYAAGNHDDFPSIREFSKEGIVLQCGSVFMEGKHFYLSHKFHEIDFEVDYYLFGHSFEPKSFKEGNTVFLNGLLNMYIVCLSTNRISRIKYPAGMNFGRKMERRSSRL